MNATNELLRAILKMDEEERLRTQATEEYRRGAQTRLTEAARTQEAEIMAAMRTRVDAFSAGEKTGLTNAWPNWRPANSRPSAGWSSFGRTSGRNG